MTLRIRPCAPGDAAALALVGQATFLESYAGFVDGQDIVAHTRAQHAEDLYACCLADPAVRLWLAEIDPGAAPVGYAMISPPDLPMAVGSGDLELRRIYLLSRFHGQGWGARLMSTAIDAARGNGARHLLLGVNSENRRALAFYARQGFAAVGRRRFQVGAHAYDDLVLARAL